MIKELKERHHVVPILEKKNAHLITAAVVLHLSPTNCRFMHSAVAQTAYFGNLGDHLD